MSLAELIQKDVEDRDKEPREQVERERRRAERRKTDAINDAWDALRLISGWGNLQTRDDTKYVDNDHIRFKIESWVFTVKRSEPDGNDWRVYANVIERHKVQREMADPPHQEEIKTEVLIVRLADLEGLVPDSDAF